MYEIFSNLLQKHGITPYKLSKEIGISQSTLSDWKRGISTPKQDKLQKIADYFGVSLNYLITGESERKVPETNLTPKDERDIAKRLEDTLNDLENSQEALMFSGEPLDEETLELLKISLENSLKLAKAYSKKKFTPKKYRNNE